MDAERRRTLLLPHGFHRPRPPPFLGELPLQVHVALLGPEAVDSARFNRESKLILVSLMLAEPV